MTNAAIHIKDGDHESLVLNVNGKHHVASSGDERFGEIKDAWKKNDWETIARILDPDATIANFSEGNIASDEGIITYRGEPVHNYMVEKIVNMVRDGLPYKPMVRALDRFMANPEERSRDFGYQFVEAGELPITEDGHFLGYKYVNNDFYADHANPDGTRNRNFIGDVVEMDRDKVDPNPNEDCSTGLHVGNLRYVSRKSNVVIVKVDPADVVCVPYGHPDKMRVCRYEVVAYHRGDPLDSVADFNTGTFLPRLLAYIANRLESGKDVTFAGIQKRFKNEKFSLDQVNTICSHTDGIEVHPTDGGRKHWTVTK